MEATLIVPDPVLVHDASDRFDRENDVTEKALADLFAAYPANSVPSQVLLKVVALNSLYSTRILAVLKLAAHITGHGASIDAAIAAGSPEAIDAIARISIGDKDFIFYSFATKYCNWHQPNLFPIYDSRVDKYLWLLKKQGTFTSESFSHRQDLYTYSSFRAIMTDFRNQFGLASFTFKQIDKFLWSQGESIWAAAEEGAREESPAIETPPPQTLPDSLNPRIERPGESLPASAQAQTFESEDYDAEYDLPSEFLKRRHNIAQADIRLNPDLIVDASPDPRDEPPED